MNCEEFELVVRDLARNEIADRGFDNFRRGDEHEPELVHVGACAACALRLQDERALSRRLDVLAAGMLPDGAAGSHRSRVASSLSARQVRRQLPRQRQLRSCPRARSPDLPAFCLPSRSHTG